MANYAEKITYWYLRFNGFFPLTNFVLHKETNRGKLAIPGGPLEHSADTDIIAIRMPYTDEVFGGKCSVDENIFGSSKIELDGMYCAIICEVKGGRSVTEANFANSQNKRRLRRAIKRIGFLQHKDKTSEDKISEIAKSIASTGQFIDGDKRIYLRLVADRNSVGGNINGIEGKFISLQDMDIFIESRIRNFNVKDKDWNFFADGYIQYKIWKVRSERKHISS